jgi:replicative DNA helicase
MNFNELDISVLKVILTSKRHAIEFINDSDEKIFSAGTTRFVKLVVSYVKVYKDVPTRRVILEQNAKNEQLCAYVNTIWDKVDSVEADDREFKHDIKKMKDRYAEKLITSLREQPEDESIEKQVSIAQETLLRIKGLYAAKAFEQKTIKESLKDFSAKYKAKKFDPSIGRGIFTGYSGLDFTTNGFRPQELIIIAAESGGGKSTLMHNMCIQMWMQQNKIDQLDNFSTGYNVLYFSLEMPYEQCMNRVLSRLADVPYKGVRDGTLSDEEEERLLKAMNFINKYPYEFKIVDVARGATAEQMELIFNETKLLYHPHIVAIDYLGLMELEDGKDEEDWLVWGKVAGKLHEFGRVNDCVMLTAVQLNRHTGKGKDAGDSVGLHRIARSATIATHANHIIQIEKRQQEQQMSDMICHMIKSRDSEPIKFKLQKRFANSALLDCVSNGEMDGFIDSDDISKQIAELNKSANK